MVSKFNALLLAGAFALPLAGTAALAQTSTGAQTSVDAQTSTGAQVKTPSVNAPSVAAPHAGAAAKSDEAAGKTHRGEHKSTAARRHHEKTGEKSSMNGADATKNQSAAVPGANGGAKAKGGASSGVGAAVDPAKKL